MKAHHTDDELEFISRLYRKYQGVERIEVFRTYVHALRTRTQWEDIDAAKVLAYAEECLSKAWQHKG
jgi:hypothetical protein